MKQALQKIWDQHTRDNLHPVNTLLPRHFAPSSTYTKLIFRENLPTSHNRISSKEAWLGLWNPAYWWNQYESKSKSTTFWWQEIIYKVKRKFKTFSYISEFQKIVLSCDKSMAPEQKFERQYETLTVSVKIWMSLWKPRRIPKPCRIWRKFSNKI